MRLPSAPRLNLSGARAPEAAAPPATPAAEAAPPGQTQALRFMEAVADLLKNTQDVGPRFAEEARRIHYGESEAKAIRGQTTPQEREALADEGIEVFTLPLGLPPKTPLQ
jgi:hypothetical protein